jgi:uncharacterized membrane protein YoaK (UPF0700 family)
MTGNTVAMARHITRLEWAGVVRRGWPLVTFVFGLLLGAFIYESEKRRRIQVPFPPAIALEALMIGIFIIAGLGYGNKPDIPPQPAGKFFLMVALLAIPMGVQNVVIRQVGGLNVYTTFVTGSLVKFAESFSQYLFWLRDHTRRRFRRRIVKALRISPRQIFVQHGALTLGLWMVYLAGAVCGGFALLRWALLAMAGPFAVLLVIALYGVFRPSLPLSGEDW